MHELSVLTYLLESVEDQAHRSGASQVVAINLVVGDRANIIDDLLLYYFDMLTPGTLSEGAALNLRRVPMRFCCSRCGASYQPAADSFLCPECGSIGQMIESIEVVRKEAV